MVANEVMHVAKPRWRVLSLLCIAQGLGYAPAAFAIPPVVNKRCPVTPLEEADSKVTMTYQGRTVAFCCDRCLAKFKTDPGKYIDRLPQFAEAPIPASQVASETHGDYHVETTRDRASVNSSARPNGSQKNGHDDGIAGAEAEVTQTPLPGRLHPVVVHFPLAGIPLSLLGLVIWGLTGNSAFAKADVPPLVVGTLAAVAAVITGNVAKDAMRFSASVQQTVDLHQIVSTAVMVAALVLASLRVWRWDTLAGRWQWVYGGGLLLTSAMLGLTGYLGGSLVFGPDHLAW